MAKQENTSLVESHHAGLEDVYKSSKIIYFGPVRANKYIIDNEGPADMPCKVTKLPPDYMVSSEAFGFQKNSELIPIISYYLQKMKVEGVTDRIMDQYFRKKAKLNCSNSSAIDFHKVASAFIVLGIVIGISILISLFEKFSRKKKSTKF